MLGRALYGRPYFLEDRELIWANPFARLSLPQNLVHTLKYLRATLASKSIAHWPIVTSKVTKQSNWNNPIAHRWRYILEMNWGTIPDKPSPFVVDAASEQLSI